MNQRQPVTSRFEAPHGDVISYTSAFLSCVAISLLAYAVATTSLVSDRTAVVIIGGLAFLQCTIQLRRFLHLGEEFKPRWKLLMFCIVLAIIAIFVIGSLWIMSSLNYRMIQSPQRMERYVQSQDGL